MSFFKSSGLSYYMYSRITKQVLTYKECELFKKLPCLVFGTKFMMAQQGELTKDSLHEQVTDPESIWSFQDYLSSQRTSNLLPQTTGF